MESVQLMLQLVVREQWRGGAGALAPGAWRAVVPADEADLVEAAAALGAGEPKRALKALGDPPPDGAGDRTAVDRALRRLALTLEHNWFPGGAAALLEPGEAAQFRLPPIPAVSNETAVLVDVADFLSSLPTLRTFAAGTRRGFPLPPDADPVLLADALLQRLAAEQAMVPAAAAALATADLFVRSGRFPQAGIPLGFAFQSSAMAADVAGVACCALAQGDWTAEPLSHPELLGEDLEGAPPGPPMAEPDPGFAADRYAEAEERFEAAGASRGVAAVALRRAALAVRAGKPGEARDALDRCRALAVEAGDGALAHLALVHRALVDIEDGAAVSVPSIAEKIGDWSRSVGSRSLVRGLARLCHARARRLRDDAGRARRALLLAEALNDSIGAITEPALVRRELVEQYASANYRRAALVMGLLDLTELERAGVESALDWMRLVDLALRADADANALREPDTMEEALGHLRRVAALEPIGQPETAWFRAQLEQAIPTSTVMMELYRGVGAREKGDLEDAERHFEGALARARALGAAGSMTQAVVLGTMRRMAEARGLVEELVGAKQLPPDLAATFLARLESYERAEQQLDLYEQLMVEPPPTERPWDRPALRAEILVGRARSREALPFAEQALERFEEHLAGLARDVLRTMASDSAVAAGLYTTAVRAHSDLSATENGAGHVASGFALSDRSRGVALTDLLELDRAAGQDLPSVAAVRAWLKAGAELARTIEHVGIGSLQASDGDIRRRIRTAERQLDDSEAALEAAAPALLAGRRRLPPPRSLAETQEQLDAGTLLIQYHAYDDQLLAWAVTADSAAVFARASVTPILTAQVRRCHRAIADRYSSAERRAELAAPLAELLLDPLSDELAAHRRVVIVPHGPLAVLPFHVLPFGGSDLSETHVVSYLPAASAARGARARRVGEDARTLVVGNPEYGAGSPFAPLPGAEAEAAAVARLRGTSALVGAAANRPDVLSALPEADLVHLATHGVLVEGAPYSAELALAQGSGLTVPDLMGLDTSVSLAVLSACDSGRGRATAAGDVIGLTRAFLAAGVHELVVSLWPVDDTAACLTMVRFHEELLRGATPASALQKAAAAIRRLDRTTADRLFGALHGGKAAGEAVRSLRKIELPRGAPPPPDFSHPSYWAPFVHVGL